MENKNTDRTIKVLKDITNCTHSGSKLAESSSTLCKDEKSKEDSKVNLKKTLNYTKDVLDIMTKAATFATTVFVLYKTIKETRDV